MARILAITSRLPYPPREGHQLRSWHLLNALAARHQVTLLSVVRDDDVPEEAGPLRAILVGLELFPLAQSGALNALRTLLTAVRYSRPLVIEKYADAALRARFATLARDADLIHIDMLPLMVHADAAPPSVPLVYNAHNVEHALLDTRARIEARTPLRALLRQQAPILQRYERAACLRADLVLACSAIDAAALRGLAPGCTIEVVPNGVDLDDNQPDDRAHAGTPSTGSTSTGTPMTGTPSTDAPRDEIVFVGQMGWFPNRDGVDWFLQAVLPLILAQRPGSGFVLVGKHDGLVVPEALRAHVRLAGFVPDVRPYVHAARVYVVPLRAGSGTRLKVLEAMALGKAIVTTRIGSEGIGLVDDDSAIFADDAQDFADAVVALLDDPARASRLGARARACAEADYGWAAIGQRLLACYDSLLPVSAARPHAVDADAAIAVDKGTNAQR